MSLNYLFKLYFPLSLGGFILLKVIITWSKACFSLFSRYSSSAFSKLQKVGIRHPPPLPFIGNLLFFREVRSVVNSVYPCMLFLKNDFIQVTENLN